MLSQKNFISLVELVPQEEARHLAKITSCLMQPPIMRHALPSAMFCGTTVCFFFTVMPGILMCWKGFFIMDFYRASLLMETGFFIPILLNLLASTAAVRGSAVPVVLAI